MIEVVALVTEKGYCQLLYGSTGVSKPNLSPMGITSTSVLNPVLVHMAEEDLEAGCVHL